MHLKTAIFSTASILVLAAAAPAFAQTATPASHDPTNAPAVDAQARVDDAAGQELVVTGIRASMRSAQNIKENAPQQIDSIVAQDIGKLPDVAISDTVARIVGVQVDRGGGEANHVLIRGLPNFTTTYNGRDIFTAEQRAVALQDFPAGGIAAVEVFKTTTADIVEGGLAGEVNVRSRRPFDFDGFKVAGALWGQYESRSQHFDPNGNLLISDRWDTSIGEIGALLSGSYTRLRYLDSTRSNTDFVATNADGHGATLPDIQRVDFGQGDRQRPSVNGALQWRPQAGLEFYAEALWQGFRNKVSDRETEVPLWGGAGYSNIVNQGSTNLVDSLTVTDPFRPDGFQGATYNATNTYQYALGGKYDAGPLHLSTDVAYTTSHVIDSVYSLDTAYASPAIVNANTGLTGLDDGPGVTFGDGTDPTSASNYIYRGFFDRQLIATGKEWQGRVDGSYDIDKSILSKLEFGARYTDRDAHFEDGSRYNSREGERLPLSAVPVNWYVSPSGFPGDDPSGIRGWYTATYDSMRDNIEALRTFNGFAQGAPPPDPGITYSANEKSWAGYGQLRYAAGPDDGVHVDGALGLRVVRTELNIAGTQRVQHGGGLPDTFTPADFQQEYTDWLPNASARIHLTSQWQLRLSYTKTRTRPDFAQYNPGYSVNPEQEGQQVTGSGGNPNLTPVRSNNYDASLEYYFSHTGSASFAIFRRDINGFIQNFNQLIDDPVDGPVLIYRPFNTGKGRIDGFEAQVTTFLDAPFIPTFFHAFGVEANLTYLDAKTGFPADLGAPTGTESPIIGVSKWTYNLAAFYELDKLSARLSWNHRGAYPSRFEFRGADPYSEETLGIGRLDYSMSYNLTKNLTLTADATNILGTPYVAYLTYGFNGGADPVTYPRAVRYEESVYSLGARFRF